MLILWAVAQFCCSACTPGNAETSAEPDSSDAVDAAVADTLAETAAETAGGFDGSDATARATDAPPPPDAADTAAPADTDTANDPDSATDTANDTANDTETANDSANNTDAAKQCGSDADCPAGGPCMVSACSSKNTCVYSTKPDGSACDDGNACSTTDVCSDGQCAGKGLLQCDDENPCTLDKCNPLAGCINLSAAASAACDDGDPCTQGDSCQQGQCEPGITVCQCKTTSDCNKFEDGNLCNGTLYCDKTAGAPYSCKVNPATAVVCPSVLDSACQKNTCLPASGQCKLVVAPANTPCSDEDKCTTGDFCDGGLCQGGTQTCACKGDADCAAAEDGNLCNGTLFCNKATAQCQINPVTVVQCHTADDGPCRHNLCNPKEGKCHLVDDMAGKPCDDGNPCTPNEGCLGGQCASAVNSCECQKDGDCAAKEDGNPCNGKLYCDLLAKKCAVNPATVVHCNSDGDTPCEQTACQPESGKCATTTLAKDGTPCDDGNPCTPASSCAGGQCQGPINLCECQKDSDCAGKEDGDLCNGVLYCDPKVKKCQVNPATVVQCPTAFDKACLRNQCSAATGVCSLLPANQGNQCDGQSICSAGGWCGGGECAVETTAAYECTKDAECAKLEDGDFCNGTLYCDKTAAKPTCKLNPATVVVCKTAGDTPCSQTQCQPLSGACQAVAKSGTCNDGKACTEQDACTAGTCSGSPKACQDSLPCTVDSCAEPYGCLNLPGSASPCDDGNACTSADTCLGGKCTGVVKTCDDGNPCTTDSCHAEKGCLLTANAAPCSDGDACTLSDGCALGTCKPGPLANCDDDNLCTSDGCDKASGKCSHLPDGAKTCSDGNLCTQDACDPVLGCSHEFNKLACTDNNPCTSGDLCSGGKCLPTGLFKCDDGKPCTNDSCDAKQGCVFTDNAKACDDGDPCTPDDACKGGFCVGGPAKTCDDSNACTADLCDPKTGACSHGPTTDSCDDANKCTVFDTCSAGKCIGKELACQDANVCTADSCDVGSGCVHTPVAAPCDAGNCTSDDACAAGKCVAGKLAKYYSASLPSAYEASSPYIVRPHGLALVGAEALYIGGNWNVGGTLYPVLWKANINGKFGKALSGVNTFTGPVQMVGHAAQTVYVGSLASQVDICKLGGNGSPEAAVPLTAMTFGASIAEIGSAPVVFGYGSPAGSTATVAMVRKFNSNMTYQWTYQGKDPAVILAGAVATDGQTMIAVGHVSAGSPGLTDGYLTRLTANGELLGARQLGGEDSDEVRDVAPVAQGGFVLTGSTASKGAGGVDGWLVRVDEAGQVLWDRSYGTAGTDQFNTVAVVADGYVLGGSTTGKGAGLTDNWLVGTDRFGNVRWERVFGTTEAESLANLVVDPAGNLLGTSNDDAGHLFRRDPWGFDSCVAAGVCTGVTAKSCDDNDPCTVDTCLNTFGCKHTPMAAGDLCSDTAVCSAAGKCDVPLGMAEVPAGKFWMGCAAGDGKCNADESPQHEVTLAAYLIDRLEVTVHQYADCVNEGACSKPGNVWSSSLPTMNYGGPARGNHPVNGISFAQAASYCTWRGKRLPTEAEWEKAARGGCEKYPGVNCQDAATLYPWGNATASCTRATFNATASGCGNAITSAVGSKPSGASPYGVQDMAGNVAEWVADAYGANYYGSSPPSDPKGPTTGKALQRGGGFSYPAVYLRNSVRLSSDANTFYETHGVRCAKSAK